MWFSEIAKNKKVNSVSFLKFNVNWFPWSDLYTNNKIIKQILKNVEKLMTCNVLIQACYLSLIIEPRPTIEEQRFINTENV